MDDVPTWPPGVHAWGAAPAVASLRRLGELGGIDMAPEEKD